MPGACRCAALGLDHAIFDLITHLRPGTSADALAIEENSSAEKSNILIR